MELFGSQDLISIAKNEYQLMSIMECGSELLRGRLLPWGGPWGGPWARSALPLPPSSLRELPILSHRISQHFSRQEKALRGR